MSAHNFSIINIIIQMKTQTLCGGKVAAFLNWLFRVLVKKRAKEFATTRLVSHCAAGGVSEILKLRSSGKVCDIAGHGTCDLNGHNI